MDCHASLSRLLQNQETLLKEKSRIRWIKEGDRNSKFYHRLLSHRSSQSGIYSLRINGDLVDDSAHIESHIIDFYSSLFSSSRPSSYLSRIKDVILPMVFDE